MQTKEKNISVIDLFCGIGGLSYGLKKSGFTVCAGIDFDKSCEFAYTENVKSDFIHANITEVKGSELIEKYWKNQELKILVGCAPCQPFSMHANKLKNRQDNPKWNLLKEFQRLIGETDPAIISMENVPKLVKEDIFSDFLSFLERRGYNVSYSIVYCPDYGIPQKRKRLVLLASKIGKISLIPKTHLPHKYVTVRDVIGKLPKIKTGEVSPADPLHKAMNMSNVNIARVRMSKPNGTWRDWDDELQLNCHKKISGKTYGSVYGRMNWNEPSPTITTQFYNFGTGRFGHPEQDRALSLREGALLQTFPPKYKFFQNPDSISISKIGIHIGNAVPVDLGFVIGKSIKQHLSTI